MRLGRVPREGRGVHDRPRRRVVGFAGDLDRLRRACRSLAVPVADRAAAKQDALGAADLVRVGIDAHPRLDVLPGGKDHEPPRPFHGVGTTPARREADDVPWSEDLLSRGFA